MELIEIRNNLIKLSYEEDERPTLGHFIALTGEDKSYVAQFVNLKADSINNFAVAKLMFSVTSDGVVIDYDGSAPSIKSDIIKLPVNELLRLLPVDTPIRIGQINGCPDFFDIDISFFEHNFTVFCDSDLERATFISNCVRQLFRMKEKSIIIDKDSLFDEYPKLVLGKDFKLPLNSNLIDFIFNYELSEVDVPTKAVIQDIFYAVQDYIKTLDDEFIPVESFIDVITEQYKETQMPELALLKNKLLKYSNAGIFANEASDFKEFENRLKEHNCNVINVKDFAPELQKEIINYVYKVIEKFDKYVYYFVPVANDNSDKKLLKRLLNNNHVFTIFISEHNYKYASELKLHAQDLMFFAPQTLQNDFAAYNTFLNKLSPSEGVIYGKLTQGIPLIITLEDLDLDLTKEDVFGDKQKFVPSIEEDALSDDDIYAINNLQETPKLSSTPEVATASEKDYTVTDQVGNETAEDNEDNSEPENNIILPVENIMESENDTDNGIPNEENENNSAEQNDAEDTDVYSEEISGGSESTQEQYADQDKDETEEDLSFMNDFVSNNDESDFKEDEITQYTEEELTEDDLDFIDSENNISDTEESETPPIVPVYDTDNNVDNGKFTGLNPGDRVINSRFGEGIIEKIKKYGNKTLCSIDFENVGRRLLDPSVSDLEKI